MVGLAFFGVTSNAVKAPHDPKQNQFGYRVTQGISSEVHRDHPAIDGIQYRSRYDDDELCIAFFMRASDAIKLDREDNDFDRDWVRQTLADCGFALLDLYLAPVPANISAQNASAKSDVKGYGSAAPAADPTRLCRLHDRLAW